MIWIILVLGSLFLAELYGYFLHVLLHSYWIPPLSRGHMNHHLHSYPPGKPQRSKLYTQKVSSGTRLFFGLGLEWIIPSMIILILTIFAENLLGLSWAQIVVSISVILSYTIFMFWFLHETFHIKKHKILRITLIKKWYLRARKLHDIHHHYVDDKGFLNKNYGIGFFLFDKMFKTYKPSLRGDFNRSNVKKAVETLNRHTNK